MRALLATALTLLLAGCGGGDVPPEPSGDGKLVSYQRGGGIAGTYVELVVRDDGRASWKSGYPETGEERGSFRLRGEGLADLTAAVEAALPLEAAETETLCADCFEYVIRVDGEEVSFDSVDLDEGNVSEETGALVGELEALVERHARPEDLAGA